MKKSDVPTVLIVDEDRALLNLVKQQLSQLPFIVIPTSSPSEAIHVIGTREVSVLVCDLAIPTIDGRNVIRIARDRNPNTVAVLTSTTSDPQALAQALSEGGIWRYIAKPWTQDEILHAVSDGAKLYNVRCRQQAELVKLAHDETQRIERLTTEPDRGDILQDERYELTEVIGQGGTGRVYKAFDKLLEMPVAIKLLDPIYTHNKSAVERLKEEARIAMQLSHRHIVRIHNLQRANDHYFLVMEYVEGRTFREILKATGPLPLHTVVQIIRVSAEALGYAHRRGVVHKDLKPSNILLSEDGILKIIDFGIAGLANAQEKAETVFGTPVYMSPEQLKGEPIDATTDIYAMGIIVYELLTCRRPFPEDDADPHMYVHGPRDLPGLTPDIEFILENAVAEKRENRWPTIHAFAHALSEAARPLTTPPEERAKREELDT